ncbi:MAG TPA: protein kinase, partial [Pirellulaceae bacterium]|nr:protein kinase [Pirellulaceae bacterium]
MTTWNPQANALFLDAVELRVPHERLEFLDRTCADNAELRAEVEAMLAASEKAGSFLEAGPARGVDTLAQPVTERPGSVIGPYKLLQQIGEGGMGVVWMAEQTEPVKRKVAVKVIKPGMDSRQVIARFEAERQALAMMDHVNIARVLDAGTTEAGRPYFVMELVHGVPITKYCDDNHLTPRERLELFVPVCQAIQHAHQKGIIHRDIKPSNVMVTLYDGKPVPKVIDFGVAKATEQKLTERTLFTQYGTMVGTLEYMSPEQAEMSALGVDTRSDIFSLGVLLYELLTGSTPLTHKRMKDAAYAEILRMIKEEEPQKPSTRLSESGDALASISAQRHMEPAKLSKLMRGELDWIVMKTLEKDRTHRYETASGLAADVQRYLSDEPVQACPPSAGYRFRKFARRNKVALGGASAVAAALLLGIFGTSWQAYRATQQRDRAVAAEELAEKRLEAEVEARRDAESERQKAVLTREETETQRQIAEAQRQLAEANLQKAREAVDQMLTRVAEERLRDIPQMEPVRRALLEDALKFYQGFLRQSSTDPGMRRETAYAYHRVGFIQNHLGQPTEAKDTYQEAISLLQKLVAEFPSDVDYRTALADSYGELGGVLTYYLANPEEAEKALRESLSIRVQLAAQHPGVDAHRSGVADAQIPLAIALSNARLGSRLSEAEELLRQALAVREKLAAEYPSQYGDSPAWVLAELGRVVAWAGRPQEAETLLREALAICEKYMAEDPTAHCRCKGVADMRLRLGEHLLKTGQPHKTEEMLRQALLLHTQVASKFPSVPRNRADLGGTYLHLGHALAASDRAAEAEQAYRQALEILERVLLEAPRTLTWRTRLVQSQDSLVQLLQNDGRNEQAEQLCRQAVASFEKLATSFPTVVEYRLNLAGRHLALATLLRDIGKPDEAANAYRQVLANFEKAIELGLQDATALNNT